MIRLKATKLLDTLTNWSIDNCKPYSKQEQIISAAFNLINEVESAKLKTKPIALLEQTKVKGAKRNA